MAFLSNRSNQFLALAFFLLIANSYDDGNFRDYLGSILAPLILLALAGAVAKRHSPQPSTTGR